MKTIATFSTPAEAHLALARLASAGVGAAARDECIVELNWLYSNAVGGVKIEVSEEDVADARAILALRPTEEGLLRCPFCGSSDTTVRVLNTFGALCILLKLPIPMTRAMVDCRGCRKTHDVPIAGGAG